MKHRIFVFSFVALAVLAVTVAWLFTGASRRPDTEVSLTLLGYTNNVTGLPMFGYAASNIAHSGFALFSARNPTRSHFACFLSGIYLRHAGIGEGEVIPLKGTLYFTQMNKTPPNGMDFELPPGATVTFSVPVPDAQGTWQCLLNLIRIRNYKHGWQFRAAVFAQRLGLHFGEQGQVVFSQEIVQ